MTFTDMLDPVTQFMKYGNVVADNENDRHLDASRTPNHGIVTLTPAHPAFFGVVPEPSQQETLDSPPQTIPQRGIFRQIPDGHEFLLQWGAAEDDIYSKLSNAPVCGGNGGNSHFPDDIISMTEVDPALNDWRDQPKADAWKDVSTSLDFGHFNLFGGASRAQGGAPSPTFYHGGNNKSVYAQEQFVMRTGTGQHGKKRRGRREKCRIFSPTNVNDSISSQTSDLNMADALGRCRESVTGKRKRTKGGPEAVLEGIFIVTRSPKNGETKSIANHIGWTFEEVNKWFENRALWEVSHPSSAASQNLDMLSANSTISRIHRDSGDSGFFELSDSLAGAIRPKKRLKRHPLSFNKIKDRAGNGDGGEEKTYHCIHEECAYRADKFGEWKRHMASIHYPGRWACVLQEADESVPANNACLSCEVVFQSVGDLKKHIHLSHSCIGSSALVKVFDRKDKLVPHWEKCHGFDARSRHPGDEGLCEREIRGFDQQCGFCELSFTDWDSKIEHVGVHFKDEGRKISAWRYPRCDRGGSSTVERGSRNESPFPDDTLFISDAEPSDSDDSDDDDDMEDGAEQSTYARRNDRDRDKDGNSGSGGTFHPPADGGRRGGSGSSSKKSNEDAKHGMGPYARHGGRSSNQRLSTADTTDLAAEDCCWHPESHYFGTSGATPPHHTIRTLGSGGFGDVNEIRIEGSNQVVAKKRVQRFPDRIGDFSKELEMIRKLQDLNHPHIIRFLGFYSTEIYVDILMLPVADYDLNDFMLYQQPPVPENIKRQVIGFYSCLVSAIQYLHKRGIRHRDIKPKNILVAKGRVFIADFGSASDTYYDAENESVGITPKYTAPEVSNGGRHGYAADIWSLGCVFMELATIIHDKTLLEFETFRSKGSLKAAQPFHKTIGKIYEWQKVLSEVGRAQYSMWRNPSICEKYWIWRRAWSLDILGEMLQEDKGKRPTASELLRRFSPLYCCSNNLLATIYDFFLGLDIPRLEESTKMDQISENIANSRNLYPPDLLPIADRPAVEPMRASEIDIKNSFQFISNYRRSGDPKKVLPMTGTESASSTHSSLNAVKSTSIAREIKLPVLETQLASFLRAGEIIQKSSLGVSLHLRELLYAGSELPCGEHEKNITQVTQGNEEDDQNLHRLLSQLHFLLTGARSQHLQDACELVDSLQLMNYLTPGKICDKRVVWRAQKLDNKSWPRPLVSGISWTSIAELGIGKLKNREDSRQASTCESDQYDTAADIADQEGASLWLDREFRFACAKRHKNRVPLDDTWEIPFKEDMFERFVKPYLHNAEQQGPAEGIKESPRDASKPRLYFRRIWRRRMLNISRLIPHSMSHNAFLTLPEENDPDIQTEAIPPASAAPMCSQFREFVDLGLLESWALRFKKKYNIETPGSVYLEWYWGSLRDLREETSAKVTASDWRLALLGFPGTELRGKDNDEIIKLYNSAVDIHIMLFEIYRDNVDGSIEELLQAGGDRALADTLMLYLQSSIEFRRGCCIYTPDEKDRIFIDLLDGFYLFIFSLPTKFNEGGREAVFILLLETGKVEFDAKDDYIWTLLSCASWRGHEAIVKLLLEAGKVAFDTAHRYTQTLLFKAIWDKHEAVVKWLHETAKVEIDAENSDNRTPLSWAARRGHEAVFNLLFETGKVESNAKDGHVWAPLLLADERGHEAVVKLLLEIDKVEVDAKNRENRTLLSWSAKRGHEAVVKLLLEAGKVEVDVKDGYNRTLLYWAAGRGHEDIVKLLLGTGKVEVDTKDSEDWPIHYLYQLQETTDKPIYLHTRPSTAYKLGEGDEFTPAPSVPRHKFEESKRYYKDPAGIVVDFGFMVGTVDVLFLSQVNVD